MSRIDGEIHKDLAATARRDGRLDFKDEGENGEGVPVGNLTIHSSAEPVFRDGRWVTKVQANRFARQFGVELFEY